VKKDDLQITGQAGRMGAAGRTIGKDGRAIGAAGSLMGL